MLLSEVENHRLLTRCMRQHAPCQLCFPRITRAAETNQRLIMWLYITYS
jgi:hypothetical protein